MLDASNSRGYGAGFNMTVVWQVFYLAVWCNLGFLLPLSVFLYETDDEKSACERIATTICEVIITVGVVCVLTFVSWVYLKGASLPIEMVATSVIDSDLAADITSYPTITETTMSLSIAIPYYITGLMVFFGYLVLICCGGCGLTALPLDLILQFRMRPRWRRTSEANAKKQELRAIIEELVQTGEHLKSTDRATQSR
ncbi:MAG: LMBR1 domain-containing protein [Actinobacteria bacterium]|nr:LMBR1 domain-containing protein [Actinomycetota bacterium]